MQERSLLGAFASGVFSTVAFVAAATFFWKLSPDVPAVTVAARPDRSLLLDSPLHCDARVRQSGSNESPRARLLYAGELYDARCYVKRKQ